VRIVDGKAGLTDTDSDFPSRTTVFDQVIAPRLTDYKFPCQTAAFVQDATLLQSAGMSDEPKPMDSGDLTTDQAEKMNRSLFPLVHYLCGTVKRMERAGFAWRYVQYDKPGEFTAAEREARDAKRGLWADPHPVPPWEFRRERRRGTRAP
jgi:hypothetical protein